MKKKRGRPRKYRPDGSVSLLSPMPISASAADGSGSFSLVPVIMAGTVPAVKRGRGRPLGSLNKPKPVLGFSGNDFFSSLFGFDFIEFWLLFFLCVACKCM